MKDSYVIINNIKLHYVEEGEGPLVILLHGFPDFWYVWRKQLPALSKNYRVVAPDMRGYNLSDKPKQIRNYRLNILASDIAELIKNLGEEQAIVVGHDWGGGVAWKLAANYPKLVSKLAVLNCPYPLELKKKLLKGNLAQWRKSYYIFLFQIPFIPEWIIGRNLEKFFSRIFKKIDSNELAEYVKAYSRTNVLRSTIGYYRALIRYMGDIEFCGTKIAMPVLMIWGEQDIALEKELTYNTKKYCTDLEIVYDSKSGHWIQLDNPELVNTKLLEFFGK